MRKQTLVKYPVYYATFHRAYDTVRTNWTDWVKQNTGHRISRLGNLADETYWTAIYYSTHA